MISKGFGAKFYSKKRLTIANYIYGGFAGGASAYFFHGDLTNLTNVVFSILAGMISGDVLVHMIITPKVWLYRFRQVFKAIKINSFHKNP